MTSPDVLIVGAGLIGAATAYECARLGLRVVVIDRAGGPAEGATRWSQAGASWLSATRHPGVLALSREGLERHRSLSAELDADTGFRPIPSLNLAREPAALDRLAALLEIGRQHGFEGELLGEQEARTLEPGIAPDSIVGAARCQQGHVDPPKLVSAWLAAACRLGAQVRYGVDVSSLRVRDGRWHAIHTPGGELAAGSLLLATGAWTRQLLRETGHDVPVLHTHAEILETEPLPPTLSHFVGSAKQTRASLEREMAVPDLLPRWNTSDTDELVPATVQFGAVQYADGRILLGQVSRAVPGFLDGPLPDGEERIRAAARAFFPALADATGRMRGRPVAISVDRLPVAGPLAALPNLFVASGFDSPVIYAPSLARRLATALTGEHVPELGQFSPDRLGATEVRSS